MLEPDDLRANSQLRGEQRRLVLVSAVDAQDLRVLASDPQHQELPADGHLEVVVRDAAA